MLKIIKKKLNINILENEIKILKNEIKILKKNRLKY